MLVLTVGSEARTCKYLPDLLSGRKLGAFGLTEPNAGTGAPRTMICLLLRPMLMSSSPMP